MLSIMIPPTDWQWLVRDNKQTNKPTKKKNPNVVNYDMVLNRFSESRQSPISQNLIPRVNLIPWLRYNFQFFEGSISNLSTPFAAVFFFGCRCGCGCGYGQIFKSCALPWCMSAFEGGKLYLIDAGAVSGTVSNRFLRAGAVFPRCGCGFPHGFRTQSNAGAVYRTSGYALKWQKKLLLKSQLKNRRKKNCSFQT